MQFRGGGVGHKVTQEATQCFFKDRDELDAGIEHIDTVCALLRRSDGRHVADGWSFHRERRICDGRFKTSVERSRKSDGHGF